jgi:conjugal transfer/entry exclusion protein
MYENQCANFESSREAAAYLHNHHRPLASLDFYVWRQYHQVLRTCAWAAPNIVQASDIYAESTKAFLGLFYPACCG